MYDIVMEQKHYTFPCFINFENEFGSGYVQNEVEVWSLGGKLGIDHMRGFREKKCQNGLVFVDDFQCQNDLVFSLMIFSVRMTQFSLTIFSVRMTFFLDDFQCQNDFAFTNDFQYQNDSDLLTISVS